jgi:hypothetical protein
MRTNKIVQMNAATATTSRSVRRLNCDGSFMPASLPPAGRKCPPCQSPQTTAISIAQTAMIISTGIDDRYHHRSVRKRPSTADGISSKATDRILKACRRKGIFKFRSTFRQLAQRKSPSAVMHARMATDDTPSGWPSAAVQHMRCYI